MPVVYAAARLQICFQAWHEIADLLLQERRDRTLSLDDRFIPVRAEAVTLVIDQEVGGFERAMPHAYAPFNPDRDTVLLPGDEPSGEAGEADGPMRMFANLLWQANFEEMNED
jgi:hypothetical protein